jgi:hypothetical protein
MVTLVCRSVNLTTELSTIEQLSKRFDDESENYLIVTIREKIHENYNAKKKLAENFELPVDEDASLVMALLNIAKSDQAMPACVSPTVNPWMVIDLAQRWRLPQMAEGLRGAYDLDAEIRKLREKQRKTRSPTQRRQDQQKQRDDKRRTQEQIEEQKKKRDERAKKEKEKKELLKKEELRIAADPRLRYIGKNRIVV